MAARPVTLAEDTRPGTNWKQVSPGAKRKISPIVRHYMKSAHPFTECVRDNRKRFGDRAEQVCAVVKDMGKRTTKWRGNESEQAERAINALIEAGQMTDGDLEVIARQLVEQMSDDEIEAMPPLCRFRVAELGEARFEAVEAIVGEAGVHLALAATVEEGAPVELRELGEDLLRAFELIEIGAQARHEDGKWEGIRSRLELQEAVLPWDAKKHPRGRAGTRAGGKFVSKGSGGSAVRAVQRRVGVKVDGKYGSHTARAVRSYQKRHGLKVDGIVGRQTSLALRGHYNAARKATPGAMHSIDRRRLGAMGSKRKTRTIHASEDDGERRQVPLAEAWGRPWEALKHPRGPGGKFRETPDAPKVARSRAGFGTQAESTRKTPRTTKPPPRRSGIPKTSIAPKAPRRPQGPKDVARDAPKIAEKELPKAVGTGVWSKQVASVVPKLTGDFDTEKAYRTAGGKGPYTPERTALHARIASLLLQGAPSQSKPQALFLAGGPASGKTSIVRAGGADMNAPAVDVNPDIVRTMLPEYDELVKRGDKAAAAKTHEEASHLSKMVANLAMARKQNILVDGTGNSGPGKFAGKVEAAMAAGYDTRVVYATIPTEEAVSRANARGKRSGRFVPEGYLRACHRDVSARYLDGVGKLKVAIDIWDNSGKTPRLIAQHGALGVRTIHDEKAYEAFTSKAGG